jgi:16S rRNA (adenine1518-N6/adenine1519-N6)-dimethyltransferase
MAEPKKSLGQHWLKDEATLAAICDAADLSTEDTVLEIGPGLGHLTRQLLKRAGQVIAVELDEDPGPCSEDNPSEYPAIRS